MPVTLSVPPVQSSPDKENARASSQERSLVSTGTHSTGMT